MAASSSSSCNPLTFKAGEVGSADPQPHAREDSKRHACDTFSHALQGSIRSELPRPAKHGPHRGTVTDESDVRNTAPTRKAEREKLRRDRLNEQLLELAGALDPDRPKNDKSTVLADVIQALKELMADIQRLRAEHALLVDESQDLSQEKKELRDERVQLISKVQRLQNQVSQQMHAMLFWMTADPANMMGAYTASSSSHSATDTDGHARLPFSPSQMQIPFFGPQPMSLVPAPMAVHLALQAHCGYTGRAPPYFPSSFNYSDGQAEGPPAQVPQSFQGYPLQVHHSSLMHPMQPLSQALHLSQVCESHYPYTLHTNPENQNASNAGEMAWASSGRGEQHPGVNSVKPCNHEPLSDASRHVQTTLQLQSPATTCNAQLHQTQQALENQDPNEARFLLRENTSSQY